MTMSNETNDVLSTEVKQQIDHWVAKYPTDQKQSAVMAALTIAQDANEGWLSNSVIEAVAEYLDMPKIAVYEVATFYSMYDLEPVGRHKINVCTNISCMLCGSDKIVSHLEKKLGIKMGETTPDGKFTLRGVECLAACVDAPMMQINKDTHLQLNEEKIDAILKDYE